MTSSDDDARAWTVDMWVAPEHRWAEVGGWFAALPEFDNAEQAEQRYRDALAYYLEHGTRLPGGRYRVTVAAAAEVTSAELEFERATPLSPAKPLRRHWDADYSV